ncbi:nucleotidyltransferase family protein [Egbenema bharatensis]|uniref:nucleotidyltransferase family protein n=1 Tax=Egbenema bharatensis TaxID=3463334 RepID=UPI003A89D6AF
MTVPAIELPMEEIAEFCRKWQVVEFALFSSVLRDDFRSDSDIDVMVQFHSEAHPTLFDLAYMEDELKLLFQRDVDLVTRKGIETSRNYLRRKAILSSSWVIYGTRPSISDCNQQYSRFDFRVRESRPS